MDTFNCFLWIYTLILYLEYIIDHGMVITGHSHLKYLHDHLPMTKMWIYHAISRMQDQVAVLKESEPFNIFIKEKT